MISILKYFWLKKIILANVSGKNWLQQLYSLLVFQVLFLLGMLSDKLITYV